MTPIRNEPAAFRIAPNVRAGAFGQLRLKAIRRRDGDRGQLTDVVADVVAGPLFSDLLRLLRPEGRAHRAIGFCRNI